MNTKFLKYFFGIIILISIKSSLCKAQYPHYFSYNNENGLPSNEVYSIIQDNKGFIWLGCDAGLYKFDGVRYTAYKCKTQNSKSINDLTVSSSNKIYCHNFSGQLFCMENDTLKELKHPIPVPKTKISALATDTKGNIYVSHWGGIAVYNEQTKKWKELFQYNLDSLYNSKKYAVHINKGSKHDTIIAFYLKGIGNVENNRIKLFHENVLFQQIGAGEFETVNHQNTLWLFAKEKRTIYRYTNHKIEEITNTKLNEVLNGRRITNIKILSDNNIWICTYKGIVCFNPQNNVVELFYPELSFSDCIIDRENNYWFSTVFTGILRITDLNFKVWDEQNQLVKITNDSTYIYFATINGKIGKLNMAANELLIFSTGSNANVQSLDYDVEENTLYFNSDNRLLKLKDNKVLQINSETTGIKSFCKVNKYTFTASSIGIFINDSLFDKNWAREIKYDKKNQIAWVATNNGLFKIEYIFNQWKTTQTFFRGTQIISIDFDKASQTIFAITFDGKIYSVTSTNSASKLVAEPSEGSSLPTDIQVNRILYYQETIYIASNKGVFIYKLKQNSLSNFNSLSGLASDNVQDITITQKCLWIATGKGLQKIPLNRLTKKKTLAKIYLKNFKQAISNFKLNYNEVLILFPEASTYNSNGQFEYAYRINKNDYIKLPSNIEQIELQNLPTGDIEIELKAIDYLNRSSENIIVLKGYVNPPFYKTWWFVLCLIILALAVFFLIVKKVIVNIRQREQEKTQLINSQLTALKAQMNPHFMYNTLNSIQALILKQDIKNTNLYLSKFSHLMRKVLDVSGRNEIHLQEETEILELYLSLEKLRFGSDFTYQINIANEIDIHNIYLPPLLLQPFVENAIKHGLLHKKGEKKLFICLEKKETILLCIIKDNGIGRKRSAEIKQRQQENHQSFSTEATQKRLELLNRTNNQKIELTINDLYENNLPSGTEVILKIK